MPSIPLPIQPAQTLIKIEDCNNSVTNATSNCSNSLASINHHSAFEPKSTTMQTASITTAVQTNDIAPDLATQLSYYQTHGLHGNLIQIASHPASMPPLTDSISSNTNSGLHTATLMGTLQSTANILTPPDVTISTMSCLTPISESFSRSDENLDSSGVSSLPEGGFFD